VVLALADTDTAKALSVARSILDKGPDHYHSSAALCYVAEALARTDQREAIAVARGIKDTFRRASALIRIAAVMLEAARASGA